VRAFVVGVCGIVTTAIYVERFKISGTSGAAYDFGASFVLLNIAWGLALIGGALFFAASSD